MLRRAIGAILLTGVMLAGLWTGYWAYLTHTVPTPYHEMWINLNTTMPRPMRHWACDTVRTRLGPARVPPHGCQDRW